LRHAERRNCGTSRYTGTRSELTTPVVRSRSCRNTRVVRSKAQNVARISWRRRTRNDIRHQRVPPRVTLFEPSGLALQKCADVISAFGRRLWPGRALRNSARKYSRKDSRNVAPLSISAALSIFPSVAQVTPRSPRWYASFLFSPPPKMNVLWARSRAYTRLRTNAENSSCSNGKSRIDCSRETARDTKIELGTFDTDAVSNFQRNAGLRVNA